MCAHKFFTYSIHALIIKHSSEHIAKFEAKVVKMISIKSVSLKRLLQQLESLCARSKIKSVNYFDCVPFPRFPADPFFAVYNKTKHVRTPLYHCCVSYPATSTFETSVRVYNTCASCKLTTSIMTACFFFVYTISISSLFLY